MGFGNQENIQNSPEFNSAFDYLKTISYHTFEVDELLKSDDDKSWARAEKCLKVIFIRVKKRIHPTYQERIKRMFDSERPDLWGIYSVLMDSLHDSKLLINDKRRDNLLEPTEKWGGEY